MNIAVKRIYDRPTADDGQRILVDRLWPRGLSREKAALSLWLKDVAPSDELRKWYSHQAERWPEFKERYFAELDARPAALGPIWEAAARGRVTLLFSARELQRNNAQALAEYLALRAE